jgi:hypothetical protein
MMAAGALAAWQCWTVVAGAQGAAASPTSIQQGSSAAAIVSPSNQHLSIDDKEHQVQLRSRTTLGGYGGPDGRITSILAEPVALVGAQASWSLNHRYLVGVAGYGLATQVEVPDAMRIDGNQSRLGLYYGGLRLGMVASPHELVHVTFAVLAGPGSVSAVSLALTRAQFEVGNERRLGHAEMVLVVEPEVAVEANAASFMRVALGASYRYVTAVEHPGLSSGNLSSPAVSLALKFGVF